MSDIAADFDFPVIAEVTASAGVSSKNALAASTPALNERLAVAIESKDAAAAQALFATGMKMPSHLRGDRTVKWLLTHFDQDVANVLSNNKLPLPNAGVILRLTASAATPAPMLWLRAYADKLSIRINVRDVRRAFGVALQRNCLDTAAAAALWSPASLSSYDRSQAFQRAIESGHTDLMSAILTHASLKQPTDLEVQRAKSANRSAPRPVHELAGWLYSVGSMNYTACLNLQSALTVINPVARKNWSDLFPTEVSDNVNPVVVNGVERIIIASQKTSVPDLLHLLVVRGAPALSTLVTDTLGAQKVAKILTSNPTYLLSFLRQASNPTITAVRASLAPHLENWSDKDGNTWSHYAIASNRGRVTKALSDELYAQNFADLLRPNALGFTAADCVSDSKVQSYLNKRLIKKALNNQGTGLIQNRTAKSSRRM